jgi:hypothetical protein
MVSFGIALSVLRLELSRKRRIAEPMNQIDPRLKELERLDRWLLSRTRTELRQMALLVAMAVNFPNAWVLSHSPAAPDVAVTTAMVGEPTLPPL